MSNVNSQTCGYCYLDIDIDNERSKLRTAAAFVDGTDSRYGFSSKDLRKLGGSELARIPELLSTDHEWSSKNTDCGGAVIRPPCHGTRIVLRLFWDVAPLACENFAALCSNGATTLPQKNSAEKKKCKPPPMGECGKPMTYRDCSVHRVVPDFVMQSGDFVFGNGSGGESIYNGKKFKDERAGLALKHDRRGILSMGNSRKNSNTSQFFVTFDKVPQCDGKHVIFGEVISGWKVLDAVEKVGTSNGEPTVPVKITDCGIFGPLLTPGAGYWFDAPDIDSFSGISSVFVVRPRVAVLAPTLAIAKKFQGAMGTFVSGTFLAMENEVSERAGVDKIIEMLKIFAIDIVIVAPACSDLLPLTELPPSWTERGGIGTEVSNDEVVLIAKPIDALKVIQTKSWVGTRTGWQLDGFSSSS